MPVEELGLRVLERLADADHIRRGQLPNRSGTIQAWVVEWHNASGSPGPSSSEVMHMRSSWTQALGEAWDWLIAEGLLAQSVPPFPVTDAYFITRRAVSVLEEADPLAVLRARRRLGLDLHDSLATRLASLTRAGAFEQAAFDALRAVEVRVRQLADDPRKQNGSRLVGTDLMHFAFKDDGGPLADPEAERGERQGVMELFAGAFGAVRNPLGHDNVEWADSTEAAEMVLLADLLMRMLDRVEHRLTAADQGDAAAS